MGCIPVKLSKEDIKAAADETLLAEEDSSSLTANITMSADKKDEISKKQSENKLSISATKMDMAIDNKDGITEKVVEKKKPIPVIILESSDEKKDVAAERPTLSGKMPPTDSVNDSSDDEEDGGVALGALAPQLASSDAAIGEGTGKPGCKYCSSIACCSTHALLMSPLPQLSDPFNEERNATFRKIAAFEIEQHKHKSPLAEFARREEAIENAKIKKMSLSTNETFGPFCCIESLKENPRGHAASVPDGKEELINDFIKALMDGKVEFVIGKYTDEQLRAVEKVFKVNPMTLYEDASTWLFVPAAENDKGVLYHGIIHCETAQKFNNMGNNAYMSFFCKAHKQKYRVGCLEVTWSKKRTWATYGYKALDVIMKLPLKEPFDPLGYGRLV